MRVLVVGFSIRHIACSAARADHFVVAGDCYCDLDLERCVSKTVLLPHENAELSIQAIIDQFAPDAIVLGSGLEEARIKGIRVLNNPPEKVAKISDKLWLAQWLEGKGFPAITTQTSLENMDFPAVIKPRKGAGGVGCKFFKSEADLKLDEGLILQRWIKGLPASVSVIGNGRKARAIAVNEQLIGAAWAGADEFRYNGNITPLEPPHPEIAEIAEEIISKLKLVGSNGVDFLLADRGPVVVEVNPRFQGSLDTVELSTGLNVFQAHSMSFQGHLPDRPRFRLTAGRAILYAEKDLKIDQEMQIEGMADIPRPGSIIKKGDPVASFLATGINRKDVLGLLMKRTRKLRRKLTQGLNKQN